VRNASSAAAADDGWLKETRRGERRRIVLPANVAV